MWGLIVGTCLFVIQADSDNDREARHEAVCVVRVALLDLYDFAEEISGPSADINEVRARLNRIIPQDGCPR